MKRQRSNSFTQEENTELVQYSQNEMSGYAASRSRSKFGGKFKRKFAKPSLRTIRQFPASNSCIIARIVDYDLDFTADPAKGFGWSPGYLWVNGIQSTAIPGASEISALFDLVRIQKVEMTILPAANSLEYGGVSSKNIPWVYTCYDPNDSTAPTLTSIRENNSTKTDLFDKPIRRTFYPQLTVGTQLQTDIGVNRKNIFASSSADVPWYGAKILLDLFSVALTYDVGRVSFKIYYECRNSI